MADPVVSFLGRHGPSLTSAVGRHLVASEHLSPAGARKRIQRAKPPVRQLSLLRLAHNERILYLASQAGSEQFVRNVTRLLDASGSVYAHTIHSIAARGGACPVRLMPTFSGSPTRRKGQLGYEVVLNNLAEVGLISRRDLAGCGACFVAGDSETAGAVAGGLRARLVAETIFLGGLRDWLRRLGLVSFDAASTRSTKALPEFGGYHWDLVGPSYVRPLASASANDAKPGFVVADVMLGNTIAESEIRYFVRKTQVLRNSPATRPFLAILVADEFAADAWRLGRREGFVITTPERIFGEAVARALATLIRVLTDAGTAATKDPDVVWELFERLGQIEGAAGNLRGPLFEMIAAHLVHSQDGREIEIGRVVTTPQHEKAEVDVLGTRGDSILALECKGRLGEHFESLEDVKDWLETKVPKIMAWLKSHPEYASRPCSFEYWTTGKFSQEAAEYLTTRRAKTQRYGMSWRDGQAVLQYARNVRARRLIDTLNEHYFQHPLAEVPSSRPESRESAQPAAPNATMTAPASQVAHPSLPASS
jgi:hypothetical protein